MDEGGGHIQQRGGSCQDGGSKQSGPGEALVESHVVVVLSTCTSHSVQTAMWHWLAQHCVLMYACAHASALKAYNHALASDLPRNILQLRLGHQQRL
jgi:hypothetical protein